MFIPIQLNAKFSPPQCHYPNYQVFISINLLKVEGDIEKTNKIASDLQAVICDGLKSYSNTQDLLLGIGEGLNKVRYLTYIT